MYLDGLAEARAFADTALATMASHTIAPTPENFAIWYVYASGHSPELRRTMDIYLSNGQELDQDTLHRLYASFFSALREEEAVRDTAERVRTTLQEIIGLTDRARGDADRFGSNISSAANDYHQDLGGLTGLVERLLQETQRMAGRSAFLGTRLRESADKIEALERNLEQARLDATTDGLTGIANRKSFDAALRQSAGEAMNSGDDLSLLLVDIDHFKRVNDTWGHPVGDDVLRFVAHELRQQTRGHDLVARYGGEEFAIILPRTGLVPAKAVGDNICRALECTHCRLETEPRELSVTVSVGAACYDPGEPLSDWVSRTDSALYAAKKGGRNRAVAAAA